LDSGRTKQTQVTIVKMYYLTVMDGNKNTSVEKM